MKSNAISIGVSVRSSLDSAWECWTKPEHITQWNFANSEWKCPFAVNELRVGGEFCWRMESKDGSMGFNYSGTYDQIVPHHFVEKTLDDGRKVQVKFSEENDLIVVREIFEPDENDQDLQRKGWQAILENFKKYVESI